MKKRVFVFMVALIMFCSPMLEAAAVKHYNRVEEYSTNITPASSHSSIRTAHAAAMATNYRVGWENRTGAQSFYSAFSVAEDGLVQMFLTSPQNSHMADERMDISIYRSGGEKIWSSDTEDATSGCWYYVGLEKGNYFISLEVNFTSLRTDGLESGFWMYLIPSKTSETEPNNTADTADIMPSSGSLRGWIDNPYWEVDYFAIEAEKNSTGYVTVWYEDVPEDVSLIDSLSAERGLSAFTTAIRESNWYGPFPNSTRLYSRLSVYFVDSTGKATRLPRQSDLMETKGELNQVSFTKGTNYIVVCGFEPNFDEQLGYCIQWDVKDTHVHNYMTDPDSFVNNCMGESYHLDSCSICGSQRKIIEESSHQFAYEHVYPTCTEPGHRSAVCSQCGYKEYDEVLPPAHNFARVEVYTHATCAQEGFAKYECVLCGYVEDRVVPTNAHRKYVLESVVPTCMEPGYVLYECYGCDAQFKEEYPIADHEFEYLTTLVPAGCGHDGLQTGVCRFCNEEIEISVPDTGHDYYATVLDAGNCSTPAELRMDCRNCDSSYMAQGDRGEHKWNSGRAEGDKIVFTCTYCGEEKSIDKYFADVGPGWYAESVTWAVDEGISTGVSASYFAPDSLCTRAQVVTFLWRAAGEPEEIYASNPFVDVSANAYYYKAVLWAVANGITTGVDSSHFAPDKACTRAQVVSFLHRAEGLPPAAGENSFADISNGLWCHDAVLWAVNNGITNGLSKTSFGPNEPCTRAQVLTFLWRDLV